MLRVAEAAQRTDTGRQREANEDAYFARAPVFAVADGMGGAQAGEVASRIAVEAFEPERGASEGTEGYLRSTAEHANRRIFELAQGDRTRSGMGTTLTAAVVEGDEVSFAHVGDSRAYLYREGRLSQLTNDHSLVEELRRQGKLTRDEAAEHPQRSVITRALGPEPEVAVDTLTVRARPGDVFVLCSDGLTTMLSDEDVTAVLAEAGDLDEAARRLVRAANERGGRDNITVVLFRLEDPAAAPAAEGPTLVGPAAEGAALGGAASTASRRRPSSEVLRRPPARRGEQEPGEAPAPATSRRRWPRRALISGLVVLVLALVLAGAVYGSRQVWFLGTDDGGRVSLYRGLPYELPFGIELYSEDYASPITLAALPEDRRAVVTDHELRSRDDAVSLIEDLRTAVEEQAAAEREESRTTSGPGGAKDGGKSGKNADGKGGGGSGGGGGAGQG